MGIRRARRPHGAGSTSSTPSTPTLPHKTTSYILDGGAYVGYTSLLLAALFPHAVIVAVEPDGSNFQVGRKLSGLVGGMYYRFEDGRWSMARGQF